MAEASGADAAMSELTAPIILAEFRRIFDAVRLRPDGWQSSKKVGGELIQAPSRYEHNDAVALFYFDRRDLGGTLINFAAKYLQDAAEVIAIQMSRNAVLLKDERSSVHGVDMFATAGEFRLVSDRVRALSKVPKDWTWYIADFYDVGEDLMYHEIVCQAMLIGARMA